MNKLSIAHAMRLLILFWVVLSLGWISQDQLVRDGDEEGHVGNAELYLPDLQTGSWRTVGAKAWWGDGMGEYPQAFPALAAGWWWVQGGGRPGRTSVRAICLLGLLMAAWSTGRIARRYAPPDREDLAELAAVGTVLLLPLGNGLARHFMPEGLLMGALALALLAAVRAMERPSWGRVLVLGMAIGGGLLVKQTFVLVAAAPLTACLLSLGRVHRRQLGMILLGVAAMAGPWMIVHLSGQTEYLSQSMEGHGDAGWLSHLTYYPWTLSWLGLGPVLTLAAIASLVILIRRGEKRALWMGLLWLVGGIIILTILPKKYPRLMAPLLPAIAVWCSAALIRVQRPTIWMALTGGLAAAWLALASTIPLPLQIAPGGIDPGCPQAWLRPAVSDDLGLHAAAAAMPTARPGAVITVAVIGSPEIPCSVQSTYTWVRHLRPFLTRSGHEAAVTTENPEAAEMIIDWTQGPGQRIDVPALHGGFWIRHSVLR